MKKLLLDRLNKLKSDLAHYRQPKMGKKKVDYEDIIYEIEIRIKEVEHLLNKIKQPI